MEHNKVYVLRHAKSEYGCFGVMFNFSGMPFAVTLENEKTLIPVGVWDARPTIYHKGGYPTFEIIVPERSRILFHKLNLDTQSEGCIGVAEKYALLNNIPAVLESDEGFKEFWNTYKDFPLIKVEVTEALFPFKKEIA